MQPSKIDDQTAEWLAFVERVRSDPSIGFDEQWARFVELSEARDSSLGPLPTWVPSDERIAESHLGQLMSAVGIDSFDQLHRWSVNHRDDFWRVVIDRLGIVFESQPTEILDLSYGPTDPRWLPGALLNITDSCFQPEDCVLAIIQGRDGTDHDTSVTYGELERLANQVANGLGKGGFGPGARIALYMPMNIECVAAYLGIVRAGCAVVSIADSFAPQEVGRRLEIAEADGIITVDVFSRGGRSIALYDKVCEAGAPPAVVIADDEATSPLLRHGDLLWSDFLGDADAFESVTDEPDALTNVLFSSGTTGDPKAIPWSHLTPIKCGMDGHLHQNIGPGSVVCWPTNIGWMMGPWLIYATLLNRGCIALYEGLPSGPGFARFIERAGVSMLGVVPSLVRAWRDSDAGADWSRVKVFSSTGEPSNRYDFLWLTSRTGHRAPVIEYCGGTEIGGGYVTGTVVQPASPATFTTPALGLDLVILDDAGNPVVENEEGEVFLVPPSIGLSQTLLNRDHDEVYHDDCPAGPHGETLRRHGDQLARLPGGFYRAQGRADDTMNLGGIKVSSLELERVIDHHPEVSESAAVAVQTGGEGAEKLVVFAITKAGADAGELLGELRRRVATELNPLFKIHDLVIVDTLPRTASNKLMRRTLRDRYRG